MTNGVAVNGRKEELGTRNLEEIAGYLQDMLAEGGASASDAVVLAEILGSVQRQLKVPQVLDSASRTAA